MSVPWDLLGFATLGLVFGSAVSALAHRLPRGESWVRGRSRCPGCRRTLTAGELVPVVSFVLARGRCRGCGRPIGWRYPLTELACAAWAVLLAGRVELGPTYALLALWGFLLVALMWIDHDFQLLPDALTFPGTLVALAATLPHAGGPRHALLGIVAGSGLLWLLAWAYLRARGREGLGGGDIKLAAMFGAVLGWQLTLVTLFLAAAAGAVWGATLLLRRRGDGQTPLPFGALLAPAAMAAFLWGDAWLRAYVGLVATR